MRFAALALALALGGPAAAHPFGAEYHSLRTSVKIADRGLMVVVGLEVPNQVVLTEFKERYAHLDKIRERHQAEFREHMWERLGAGLALTVDGEAVEVEWRPLDKEFNGRGGEQFFVYMVGATIEDPRARWGEEVVVEVAVTSFPDPPMYLSSFATQEDPWTLSSTSAAAALGEHATSPDALPEGAWSKDSSLRRIQVAYERH